MTVLNHDRLEVAVVPPGAAPRSRRSARRSHPPHLRGRSRDDPAIGDAARSTSPRVSNAIRPATAPSSRCSISRATTPSRPTASPMAVEQGRQDLALYLQSRASQIFQVDIHPEVPMGKGIMLDHGTGLVVGETAVDRRRCLDPAGRDARRHRQGRRRPPPQGRERRADRRRRQDPRQHHHRLLRPHRRRFGGAEAGAGAHDRCRRAGQGHRRGRLRPAGASMDQMVPRGGSG